LLQGKPFQAGLEGHLSLWKHLKRLRLDHLLRRNCGRNAVRASRFFSFARNPGTENGERMAQILGFDLAKGLFERGNNSRIKLS
jgi:hypothetical protein